MCIAFSGIFYRFADVEPSTASVFRCLYGLPFLALVAWLEHRRYGSLPWRTVALAVLAGAMFAGDLTSWHHSIEYVGAGLATVLGNLQVLVVGLLAWLILGERPSRSVVLALPVVLSGVVLISGLADTGAYGSNPALGAVFGVTTALFYSGYLLIIRRSGRDPRRPAGPVAIATFSTALVAGAAGVPLGELNLAPSWPEHGWLFGYGVTSQFLGYLLISVSLPRLPAVVTSIILLAQPVATVILARLLLDEQPSPAQLLGVVLVVGGIAVATVPVGWLRDRARARIAERS
ncbi:MAG: DMT family transporter [Chloroflexi bacterium]|nr:DMT family transporter [Chloroflexota bacterium]